jgi:hypothetical protein
MKGFVRIHGTAVAVIVAIALAVTSLTGGSETVLYSTAIVCLAAFLWREIRRGEL